MNIPSVTPEHYALLLEEVECRLQPGQFQDWEVAKIAVEARKYWEEAGQPEGRDLDFWLKAETEYNNTLRGTIWL